MQIKNNGKRTIVVEEKYVIESGATKNVPDTVDILSLPATAEVLKAKIKEVK